MNLKIAPKIQTKEVATYILQNVKEILVLWGSENFASKTVKLVSILFVLLNFGWKTGILEYKGNLIFGFWYFWIIGSFMGHFEQNLAEN